LRKAWVATRSEALPDIPTVGDFVPGFEATFWTGLGAPKNTPPEIVDKLNKEINAALADPKMKARLTELGVAALPGGVRARCSPHSITSRSAKGGNDLWPIRAVHRCPLNGRFRE
jgi:hypothetical protein